jgi:transcriptional regulator with XRE-family HTH domain
MAPDLERRQRLHAFLMQARARLRPAEVGLPDTSRRRVPGLRREEVAELADVSADWYRWLESGRPVRVSPQLVARLARVLRLGPAEERELYHLALPEIYEADAALAPRHEHHSLLTPIESLSEIDVTARAFVHARDQFLSAEPPSPIVRPRIARSWQRSRALGVDPLRDHIAEAGVSDLAERRDVNRRLLSAAAPTLQRLERELDGTGHVVVLTDVTGCILELAGDRDARRALARVNFEPGGDLSEDSSGTNAIGTALRDGQALQLMGAEHIVLAIAELTCTAAPVRDPVTHEIIGVLDFTAGYRSIRPDLLGLALEGALEIEELLRLP